MQHSHTFYSDRPSKTQRFLKYTQTVTVKTINFKEKTMAIPPKKAIGQPNQSKDVATKKTTARHSIGFPWKSTILSLLAWIIVALSLLAAFDHEMVRNRISQTRIDIPALKTIGAAAFDHCAPLPDHGTAFIIDPSVMNRTDVRYSGLEIHNDHDYPMIAVLSDPEGSRQVLALTILPERAIQISVPVGQYGMQLLVGSKWCNLIAGFSDGAQVSVSGKVTITPGVTTQMRFYGAGLDPIKLALAYHHINISEQEKIDSSTVVTEGKLELKQTTNGHYFSAGAINDAAVMFMIDTGATFVAISAEMATRAGIQKCTPHFVITANDKVQGCAATAAEITFGPFKLTNVTVSILPGMPGDALLGMNVLRNFHIEQVDNLMRISSQ